MTVEPRRPVIGDRFGWHFWQCQGACAKKFRSDAIAGNHLKMKQFFADDAAEADASLHGISSLFEIGPSRHFAAAQHFRGFRTEADIEPNLEPGP